MHDNRKGNRQKADTESRIKRAMANVHASMAVEGLKPSKICVTIGKQYLEGKICSQEAIARVKARHLGATEKPDE